MANSEHVNGNQYPTKPVDPELTPSQQAMKDLTDEILARRRPKAEPLWGFKSDADPVALQARLKRTSFGDLLLNDGDSLSAIPPNEQQPDLGLYVGPPVLAVVRAWGWEYPKRRVNPASPKESGYKMIKYPGEKDWLRELAIELFYDSDEQRSARQTVSTWSSSQSAGISPTLIRSVFAYAYASQDQGYEGHNMIEWPESTDEEVVVFVGLARELFENRIERPV